MLLFNPPSASEGEPSKEDPLLSILVLWSVDRPRSGSVISGNPRAAYRVFGDWFIWYRERFIGRLRCPAPESLLSPPAEAPSSVFCGVSCNQ